MKDVTHLHGWQFFLIANCLKDLIECPRLCPNGTHPENNIHSNCKLDHYHCLYYCLKWLNDAEDLPLVASPTLLGMVLPECVSLGFGENRFTNCVRGDMKCAMICSSCQNIILTG
jgi:hypothetical protein